MLCVSAPMKGAGRVLLGIGTTPAWLMAAYSTLTLSDSAGADRSGVSAQARRDPSDGCCQKEAVTASSNSTKNVPC